METVSATYRTRVILPRISPAKLQAALDRQGIKAYTAAKRMGVSTTWVQRLLEAALEEARKDDPAERPLTRARLDTLSHQRAALHAEAERLLDLYLTGGLPKAVYTKRAQEHKRREKALGDAYSEIEGQLAEYADKVRALESLGDRLQAVREVLPNMDFQARRAFLLSMGVQVSVCRAENPREGHLVDIDGLLQPVRSLPMPLPDAIRANQWTGPKTHREA